MQDQIRVLEEKNIKIMTQGADLMAKNKEEYEISTAGQNDMLIARF